MEEAPESSKDLSHSAHANGINECNMLGHEGDSCYQNNSHHDVLSACVYSRRNSQSKISYRHKSIHLTIMRYIIGIKPTSFENKGEWGNRHYIWKMYGCVPHTPTNMHAHTHMYTQRKKQT
jgi:hypothetical protein